MTPQETDPDLPVNVQESLAEAWVGGGRPWPAAGLGALSAAVHAWDFLKEVAIIFITSTIVTTTTTTKSFQLCPTMCDPIDGSLPGSPVPGILQARTLEWVAISFSNA